MGEAKHDPRPVGISAVSQTAGFSVTSRELRGNGESRYLPMRRPETVQEPPSPKYKEVFRAAFASLGFVPFAANVVELTKFAVTPNANRTTRLSLPLIHTIPSRREAAGVALSAIIRNIDIPGHLAEIYMDIEPLRSNLQARTALGNILLGKDIFFSVFNEHFGITWEEQTPWPAAFSVYLSQLTNLINLYAFALAKQIQDSTEQAQSKGFADSLLTYDHTSRIMPTLHHYAAASLGAWSGGAVNCQFLGTFACMPQIRSLVVNTQYGERIGYDPVTARSLSEGGLIVVPASIGSAILDAQGITPTLGGLPIEEYNVANLPAETFKVTRPITQVPDGLFPGFLVDKYYRAPFWARAPGTQALFGKADILRDHYADFYSSTTHSGLLRCKHFCAPIIDVASITELRDLISMIPIHTDRGLFFRGQSKMYLLNRPAPIRTLLFGTSTSTEPSLLTAAARRNFEYDPLHFALRFFIEERVFGSLFDSDTPTPQYLQWQAELVSPHCRVDYAIMALAQHYGLPSHGLDVTSDLDVAMWFATNRYISEGQLSRYEPFGSWTDDSANWPVIFVCQQITNSLIGSLQDCHELDMYGVPALRPQRQRASFFLGGFGDHQNRLAEALVCVCRLKPGFWPTSVSFEELFPAPSEDPAYRVMLDFADRWEFLHLESSQVARYHQL
jgi:hypothetical protein